MITEDDLTLDGGHTMQYEDMCDRNVYLKLYNLINQCHSNVFNKNISLKNRLM